MESRVYSVAIVVFCADFCFFVRPKTLALIEAYVEENGLRARDSSTSGRRARTRIVGKGLRTDESRNRDGEGHGSEYKSGLRDSLLGAAFRGNVK